MARLRRSDLLVMLFAVLLAAAGLLLSRARGPARQAPAGELLVDARTSFSQLRVRALGERRRLLFVRDDGVEVLQTEVDLAAPHRLRVEYTQAMFGALLLRPLQRRVLLVGLGGGAMVHFLRHHWPQVEIDAVEIDGGVVGVAREHFALPSDPLTRVFVQDGLRYLEETTQRYDAIYMDAFLKPGEGTDATGAPLHLKTLEFLKGLRRRLKPGGVVAFNLNEHEQTAQDLELILRAFPEVHRFGVAESRNIVAVACPEPLEVSQQVLLQRAAALDRLAELGFSFEGLLSRHRRLAPEPR